MPADVVFIDAACTERPRRISKDSAGHGVVSRLCGTRLTTGERLGERSRGVAAARYGYQIIGVHHGRTHFLQDAQCNAAGPNTPTGQAESDHRLTGCPVLGNRRRVGHLEAGTPPDAVIALGYRAGRAGRIVFNGVRRLVFDVFLAPPVQSAR